MAIRIDHKRVAAGALFGLCAVSHVSIASADPACIIRLRSIDDTPEASWRAATNDLQAALEADEESEHDCRSILIVADVNGADVTLTGRDGRTATRRILRPRELRTLVHALLVTVPLPAEDRVDEPVASSPAVERAELPTESDGMAPGREMPAKRETDAVTGPLLALGAGLTAGAGDVGSVAQLEAGYLTHGWELALVGRVEPEHDGPASSVRTSLSAAGASAMAARRWSVGTLSFLFGGELGVFAAREEGPRPTVDGVHRLTDEFIDPRLGAIAGCLAPRTGPVRIRAQLDAQLGFGSHTPDNAALSPYPRFTLALSLGAETGFLP